MTEWAGQQRHGVYVVLLDPKVVEDHGFQEQNPEWDGRKDCYYVGCHEMPSKLGEHGVEWGRKIGIVRDYGKHLVPAWYEHLNPMSYEESVKRKEELAQRLRRRGYGVYQS